MLIDDTFNGQFYQVSLTPLVVRAAWTTGNALPGIVIPRPNYYGLNNVLSWRLVCL